MKRVYLAPLLLVLLCFAGTALAVPTVTLTAPTANQKFGSPVTITLKATATPSGSTHITKVEFFRGGSTLIGTATTSPYQFDWINPAIGSYSLTAKATDSAGGTKTSSPAVSITVQTNALPSATLSLTSAPTGKIYGAGQTVAMTATASDTDGTVAKVDFLAGTTVVGTDTSSPYAFNWVPSAAGTYSLTSKATDNSGGVKQSTATSITVLAAPTVTLTAPANNSSYSPGSTIPLAATASAASGASINKVEFFRDSTLLGSDTTSPYNFNWTNAPAGNYVLTAKATDSKTGTNVSTPVNVTVAAPHTPPDVAITAPASGSIWDEPATITLSATATPHDTGVTISKVEFFNGASQIGTAITSPPYTYNWPAVPAGGYLITAKATDSTGASTTSTLDYVIVDGADSCINAPPLTANETATRLASFGRLPLLFEENAGQVGKAVKFLSRGRDYQLFLAQSTTTVALRSANGRQAAVRMRFEGGSESPLVRGEEAVQSVTNYLIGNDRSAWRTRVPNFASIRYASIYPGVDAVYHTRDGELEYDLHVSPGVDPRKIGIGFDGAQRTEVDDNGDLVLHTAAGTIKQRRPIAYQVVDGARQPVEARYRLDGAGLVRFELGEYNHDEALVIDPVLVYSTYLSGSNNSSGAYSIALSRCGEAFVSGWTWATDYPTTPGAFDGGADPNSKMGFVSKLNQSGSGLVYSTFVTGTNFDPGSGWIAQTTDLVNIAVDVTGHAYLAGYTNSIDFPVTPGAAFGTAPSTDSSNVVAKLTRDGGSLAYATYLDAGQLAGLAIDGSGNAYVGTGHHLRKVAPDGKSLIYTYVVDSGSSPDTIAAVAVDSSGNAYATGKSYSNFQPVTTGAFETTRPNSTSFPSGFVVKVNPSGTGLVFGTYLGNQGSTRPLAIALDASNNVYIAGQADGRGFPVAVGASKMYNMDVDDGLNQLAFAARLTSNGAQVDYFAWAGGFFCPSGSQNCSHAQTVANSIAVDTSQNAWIVGTTGSNRIPLTKPINATFATSGGNNFAIKLSSSGTSMLFGTLLNGTVVGAAAPNGNIDSNASGVAIDSVGSAYVAGWTNKLDFPTTTGAYQTAIGASHLVSNAFVTKINETKDTTTTLAVSPSPAHVGTTATMTATVTGNAPTGTVSFYDGSTVIGTGTLSGTTAQYSTSQLAGGTHILTAAYGGDSHNNPSTSAPFNLSVDNPTELPSVTVTGIADGELLTANSGSTLTGKQVTVNANAAAGNILSQANLYQDSSSFSWMPNAATTSRIITLGSLSTGFHLMYAAVTDNFNNQMTSAYTRFAVNVAGATPPTLTMTAPANGATLTLPGPFTLSATATPSGGANVSGVTFDMGTQQVFALNGPNFTASWNPAPGMYRIVAKSVDSNSAYGISAPIVVTVVSPPAPTVNLTSPANGATFWTSDSIAMSATVTPVSGTTITRVDFLSDGAVVGTATSSPYNFAWTSAPAGSHSITAQAYDDRGISGTSSAATITVNSPPVPTISITSPTSGASYSTPANIDFTVNATPASGASIAKVEYFDGQTLIGTVTAAPFGYTWGSAPVGSHSVTAKATDDRGATAISNAVTLSVSYGQPTIDAAPGLDGSTVASSTVLVRGIVQAPRNSGITVNGKLASLAPDGSFFLDDVPLHDGPNSITLTLTTQDQLTAAKTITVTRQGPETVQVIVTPQEDLSGADFNFRAVNVSASVATIEFDFNGDGNAEYTATSFDPAGITVTLTGAGVVQPVIRFKDTAGAVVATVVKRLYLHDPPDVYSLLEGVFSDFTTRLASGDVTGANSLLAPQARDTYGPVFTDLGADLPTVVPQLGETDGITATLSIAQVTLVRGSGSTAQTFFIHMFRGTDGVWRIESM